jgi:transcriptional regulator with XRE-family HTH domain
MSTINQRLREFIEKKNISQVEIADKLNVDKKQFNNWMTGTKVPVNSLALILEMFPELNARWLLTGNGYMINDMNEINEPEEVYNSKNNKLLDIIIRHTENEAKLIEDNRNLMNLLLSK